MNMVASMRCCYLYFTISATKSSNKIQDLFQSLSRKVEDKNTCFLSHAKKKVAWLIPRSLSLESSGHVKIFLNKFVALYFLETDLASPQFTEC